MKYRYLVLALDGEKPQGTNDDVLAKQIADTTDDLWVVDMETGTVLGLQGDEDGELAEVDALDWNEEEEEADDLDDED